MIWHLYIKKLKKKEFKMKRMGIYLTIISSLLIIMSFFGIIKCLTPKLSEGNLPLDEIIFMPYGLLTGIIVLIVGILLIKGKEVKIPLIYASVLLPIAMAGSTIYFAFKIVLSGISLYIIFPIIIFSITILASFISFKVIRQKFILF
jgi:hypothetical protein